MFDIAWSELALVAALLLVVVGPKELPRVLRTIAIYVKKLRNLAGEFQRGVDEMIREAELDDVKRKVDDFGRTNWDRELENRIDPTGDIQKGLKIEDEPKPEPKPAPQPKDAPAGDDDGWQEAEATVSRPKRAASATGKAKAKAKGAGDAAQ